MPTQTDITVEREAAVLASYAMHSARSAGRKFAEPPHAYRGPYQRDRDRVLHSGAFRRLSYKTQVFMGQMGDYHRTRLTHTLEVSSIARTLARALAINEDLVEALALLHDVGHPPFGHSGEEVLDQCLSDGGGFNHNAQALRIVEVLEARYPEFPGLNLSREVLDGQRHRATKGSAEAGDESPLLEVQVVDIADSIAYVAHDADDSLELGLLTLDQLLATPLWHEADETVGRQFAGLDDRQRRRAIVHELINRQVGDVLGVARRELAERNIGSVDDVRRAPTLVRMSPELVDQQLALEAFLFDRVYRHPDVLGQRRLAQQALREMFAALVSDAERLPAKYRELAAGDGVPRAVADYLAGMTDRFALEAHRRLLQD